MPKTFRRKNKKNSFKKRNNNSKKMKGGSYTGYLVLITALVTYLAMLKRTKTNFSPKIYIEDNKIIATKDAYDSLSDDFKSLFKDEPKNFPENMQYYSAIIEGSNCNEILGKLEQLKGEFSYDNNIKTIVDDAIGNSECKIDK